MKPLNIKTTVFTGASTSDFPGVFGEIVQALILHVATFTDLPYTAAELEARATAIINKTNAAEHGSRDQKNERDQERSVCEGILLRCATAVIERAELAATYEERVAIVELSKFTLHKTPQPVGEITPPTPKAKMSAAVGTIGLNWTANRNVQSWLVEHVNGTDVSPSANWQPLAVVTRSKFTATDLTSGYHSFRIRAVSTVGYSVPSEAVTEYAK